MANLLVRGVDDALVQSLREQAAAHRGSVEPEHREILARGRGTSMIFHPQGFSY
jgi:plasmid stability protein